MPEQSMTFLQHGSSTEWTRLRYRYQQESSSISLIQFHFVNHQSIAAPLHFTQHSTYSIVVNHVKVKLPAVEGWWLASCWQHRQCIAQPEREGSYSTNTQKITPKIQKKTMFSTANVLQMVFKKVLKIHYSSAAAHAIEKHINYIRTRLTVIIYLKYYTMKQPTAIITNVL